MMHDIVRLTEYEKYKWEKSISSESALRDIFLVAISIRLYDISRSVVPVSYDSYNRLLFFLERFGLQKSTVLYVMAISI